MSSWSRLERSEFGNVGADAVSPRQSNVAPFILCPTCQGDSHVGCDRCSKHLVSIRDLTFRELVAAPHLTNRELSDELMARCYLSDDDCDMPRPGHADLELLSGELAEAVEVAHLYTSRAA